MGSSSCSGLHCLSTSLESMSLLGRTRSGSSQPGVFRLQDYFMWLLQVSRSLHHDLPPNQSLHTPMPRYFLREIFKLCPKIRMYHNHGSEQTAPSAAYNRQPCISFNSGKCFRQRCRYIHICRFSSGAHTRIVRPVYKAVNKKSKS